MSNSLDRAMLIQMAQTLADLTVKVDQLSLAKKPMFMNPLVIQDERSKEWVAFIEDAHGQRTAIGMFGQAKDADEAQRTKQQEFNERIKTIS